MENEQTEAVNSLLKKCHDTIHDFRCCHCNDSSYLDLIQALDKIFIKGGGQ